MTFSNVMYLLQTNFLTASTKTFFCHSINKSFAFSHAKCYRELQERPNQALYLQNHVSYILNVFKFDGCLILRLSSGISKY